MVPTRLHKMFPESHPTCWRCHKELGTCLHIWWTCSSVKRFWTDVYYEIISNMGIVFPFNPESCLLHLFTDLGIAETRLLNNLLVQAKILIAKYWKSQTIPTESEWQIKCQYSLLMNKLTAIKGLRNGSGNALPNFYSTWTRYIAYWNIIKPKHNLSCAVLDIGKYLNNQIWERVLHK